jgi:hypothetical protein
MNKAVAALSGTEAFSSKHIPAYTDEADLPYDQRLVHSPVFFWLEQDEQMNLLLRIELRMPVRHPYGRGLDGLTSGREGRAAENIHNSYTEIAAILKGAGFTDQKAKIDTGSVGIKALFGKKLDHTLPNEQDIKELAASKQVLVEFKLWNERGQYLKPDSD